MVLIILWIGFPTGETTTTTVAPDEPTKSCSIFGDPHGLTFDGQHVDLYTAGEFWIVKSPTVGIQGKYSPTHATNGLSVTKKIGVSGSFISNHKLIIGEEHASWDGMPILTTFPGVFHDPDGVGVSIVYNNQGELLQPGREGKQLHVLHVTMPSGVSLQINRWNEPNEGRYINTKITMPPQPGQDGQCGNFNGNAIDDSRMAVIARLGKDGVPADELYFTEPKTIVNQELESCPDDTLKNAHAQCKAVTTSFWPSMQCLVSVCHGGSLPPPAPVVA